MPAYWIAHAKINEPVEYKKYTDQVPEIMLPGPNFERPTSIIQPRIAEFAVRYIF